MIGFLICRVAVVGLVVIGKLTVFLVVHAGVSSNLRLVVSLMKFIYS